MCIENFEMSILCGETIDESAETSLNSKAGKAFWSRSELLKHTESRFEHLGASKTPTKFL